jgi:hypothetical protein
VARGLLVKALRALLGALSFAALPACGGDDDGSKAARTDKRVALASSVSASDFPATKGRTLQAIADRIKPGPQLGLATSVLLPRTERLAFGLIGRDRGFL